MIYSINLLMCAISAFCFKNIFTFLMFLVFAGLLFQYAIKKLSNVTILLYLLNVIVVLVGGLVIWLLPNKEDIIPSIIVDAYYLGPLQFILFISLLVSIILDIKYLVDKKKKKAKKKVEKVEIEEKNKEFKEKVDKIENTIKEKTEEIKKIVEPKEKKKVVKKETTEKKKAAPKKKTTTKKPVKKVTKKEEKK